MYGVASTLNFDDGNEINEDGVGVYTDSYHTVTTTSTGQTATTQTLVSSCGLVPTTRSEYGNGTLPNNGDGKAVLRGIFKVASDSWLFNNNQLDKFTLRVVGCTNGITIEKIIAKKLHALPTSGSIADWINVEAAISTPVHSFSEKSLFYKDNKLCWKIPADANGIATYNLWYQDISTPQTIYKTAWELRFTVNEHPSSLNFDGSVSGSIGIIDTEFRSMAFSGIEQTGNYMISFDLNDPASQNVTSWKIYREDITSNTNVTDASPEYTGNNVELETAIDAGWFPATAGDKIQFYHEIGSNVTSAQEFAISNIELIPLEQIFISGSVGAWEIGGFDISTNNYITLDNVNNYFVFDDCDPAGGNTNQFPNITQQINQVIKKDDQYKINFTHEITSGEIGVYYYNSDGYGFKITGIGGATIGQPVDFSQVVKIGESLWDPIQEDQGGNNYQSWDSDFKDSFVVVARDDGAGNDVEGFIDNISMVRVYVDEETADKTITFNEAVNGWSSFKDFVPEGGVSLSRKYFTFKYGYLFQHYIPKLQDQLGYTNAHGFFTKHTPEEADNYNVFYGVSNNSSIKAIMNESPSIVKKLITRVVKPI